MKIQKRFWAHTHTRAASVQFGATEEWNALKQTQHQQLRRVFAKFTTRALQITHCKHCRALLQHGSWPACVVNTWNGVVSICTCFPYLCFFFFFCINRQRSFFFSRSRASEVAPRWALLAAVAVTDGKDDNSSDKQWTNCTLQCRCLTTLGTHLGRLRQSSICALDALMHSKYRMIKKYAIWITFCI